MRTAVTELATAQPASLWKWTPIWQSNMPTTSDTMFSTSCGSDPPFVSQSTSASAPASAAARRTRRLKSLFTLYPSKKCSASKKTRRSWSRRNATDSSAIARASSSEVRSASVT